METYRKTIRLSFIVLVCFTHFEAFAQMQRNDWVGNFTMNHDGWEGTLVINDTKKDCSSTPWCSLDIYYIDSKGEKRKVAINRFSKDWQNITFHIQFPQHTQQFEGYLFSHDKTILAGTTAWNNKKFGFYAKKQPAKTLAEGDISRIKLHDLKVLRPATEVQEPGTTEDEIVKRRVLQDGSVEFTYKSGKVKTYADGVIRIKLPDGTEQSYMMMQVMDLVPPMPNEPDVTTWLGALNSNIDEIVSHLLNGDSVSINNYKKALSKYKDAERINNSMKTIGFLIE